MEINGMKTYIAGIATLMYAIGGVVAGKLDFNLAMTVGLSALTMMGLRHGIKKGIEADSV